MLSRTVKVITGARTAWMVVVLGLLLGALAVGAVGQAERSATPLDTLPAGYPSTEGQALLDELPDEGSQSAIVLFVDEDESIQERLPDLAEVMEEVAPEGAEAPDTGAPGEGAPGEGAAGEGAPEGGPPPGAADVEFPVIPAEDGTAALSVLALDAPTAADAQAGVAELREALGDAVPEGVTAQVTGPAAISADLASVFDGANITLLAATASVVALLLIVTYRSPVLWIIPLSVVGIGERVAATGATQVLAAFGVPWDESTLGILSVLVFGAGTNYALLLISRYRDELRQRTSRHEAMAVALRRAAEAIVASASTVMVALLCLLLSVFPSTRGLGLAAAVGILVAMTIGLVILPAVLVLFGRWIFWPRVPHVGHAGLADSRSVWRRIGDLVARTPLAWIVGTVAVLAAMSYGLTQFQTGLSPEDQFLDTPEAITAAERIGESFPAGASDPVIVVTRTQDEDAVQELAEVVGAVEGVDQATPAAPEAGIGQVQVVLDAEPGSEESSAAVLEIRAAVADATGPAGQAETYVTGGDASAVDEADGQVRDRWVIMPLILATIMVVLVGLLRSIVAPLVLVVTTVATSCAALGVSWWLFTGVLGFAAVDSSMPLLAFLFLVALGVDYNIFLITRTLEEAGTHGTREGVLRALGATGGVITSAGVLLAAVFAVLGVLPLVVLAQIGVVICIGVLLDTLVVRTVLTPAIVRILGERFWWPRRVDRVSPPRHSKAYVEQLDKAGAAAAVEV